MKDKNNFLKLTISIARILLGLTFMFSGFVKAVDPLGFSYKIEDYIKSMIDSENWYIDTEYLPLSFDQWMENENDYLEHDEHTYKMKDGENLHIFCSYGYDG